MKKIFKLFSLIMLTVSIVGCKEELNEEQEFVPETIYAYVNGVKTSLTSRDGWFYVAFYYENKDKLKAELAKVGATLYSETLQDYRDAVREDYSLFSDLSGSDAYKFVNFETDFIDGKYQDVATALSHTFYWATWYRMENGSELIPAENFYAVLKPETTLEQLEKLAKENGVEMIGWKAEKYGLYKNWYHLICTNQSKGNSFEMSALFYESGRFEDAFADNIGGLTAAIINN